MRKNKNKLVSFIVSFIQLLSIISPYCPVVEKLPTHPMEGHRKFLGEGGVLKANILEAKYEAKLEFLGGMGVAKQKTFHGGSMDIFWNYTFRLVKVLY